MTAILSLQGPIQFRNDTAANWTSVNPILLVGEIGVERVTNLYKIGDGTTAWASLPYGGTTGPTGPAGPTSFNPVGSAPNANGATVSSGVVTLQPSSQAFAGLMSALDKLKEDNIWVDAQTIGFLPTNTGAANVTAYNTWYASAPSGVTLYFAPGTYDYASELTNNRDIRIRYLGAGKGRSILRNTSATGNGINQTVDGFYISIEELGFAASVTKTAGSAIVASNNNAYFDVRRCEFTGQFRSIDYSSSGGNIGCINECLFTATVGAGSQVRINGTGINMMMQNSTINNGAVAGSAGVEVNQVGALQITACDIIGGTNAILSNPGVGQVVASLFISNTYCDNTLGSCIKITGAGATVRTKISGSSATLAAAATAGSAAIEVSTTVAAGAQGLDITSVNVLNTFGASGCNGFLMTGAADYSIQQCNIAGWGVAALNLTPHTTAGSTIARIQNNVIGSSGGYGVNATGILLNAGAAAYGALEIQNNDCVGNTTPLTNNLTTNIPTNLSRYLIEGNPGINPKGTVTTPTVPAAGATVTNNTGYRITIYALSAAAAPAAIVVNGVSTTNHNKVTTGGNAIQLDPGGTIAFTSTTAASWTWIAN